MILSIIRIAIRNVSRNLRRSLITATAVFIGAFFIIVARSLLNGLQGSLVSGFTELQAGDLQLHRQTYLDTMDALPLDKTFEINDDLEKKISQVKEVKSYSGRIQFSGMLSNGDDTTLIIGQGIDPLNEYKVCPKASESILAGGTPVKADVPDGIVIGSSLATSLNAKVGSELTLLVNTSKGNLTAKDFKVIGISDFRLPGVSTRIIQLPISTVQTLLRMEKQVTEVVIDVEELDDVSKTSKKLTNIFKPMPDNTRLAVNTWMDIGPLYVNSIELQNQVLRYIIVVLFMVMIAGIVNTMLMSVYERVREIGTMMAIGVRRKKILTMFLMESITLGFLGSVAGIGLACIAVAYYQKNGFVIPNLGSTKIGTVYPFIHLDYLFFVLVITITSSILAAFYPAVRASRMKPAEALRTL